GGGVRWQRCRCSMGTTQACRKPLLGVAPRPPGALPVPAVAPAPARFSGQARLLPSGGAGAVKAGEPASHPQGVALTEGARAAATLLHRRAGRILVLARAKPVPCL